MTDAGYRILIAGGGQAGGRLALRLRGLGFGGSIALIGEESLAPYNRPPLSKSLLSGKSHIKQAMLSDPEWYSTNRVELRRESHIESIDPVARRVLLRDGSAVAYEQLVLSLGASPKMLPVPGGDLKGVHVLRSFDDMQRIQGLAQPGRSVAIVGAGLIGLEIAWTLKSLGCDCTLIETNSIPMARVVPNAVAQYFSGLLAHHSLPCLFNTKVTSFSRQDDRILVALSGGESIACDFVVVAIGVAPNAKLAGDINIAVDDGILTDETGRTSREGIFAIGDVARVRKGAAERGVRLETWHNAEFQAERLAEYLACGSVSPSAQTPWFWTDQFDMQSQFVGDSSAVDEVLWRRVDDGFKAIAVYLKQNRVVGGAALGVPKAMRQLRRWVEPGASGADAEQARTYLASAH